MKRILLFFCALATFYTHVFALTAETERLIVRPLELEDAYDLFECTSDPEVVMLTGLFKLHTTVEDTREYIKKQQAFALNGNSMTWAIVYKSDNKVIGIVSLFGIGLSHFKAEIGYAVSRAYWAQGIATEASQAVLEYAFTTLGLNRIQATYDPRNLASGRVLEKLGFTYEGFLRDYYYLNNEFCHRMIVSLLKNEYTYRLRCIVT